MNSGVKIKRKTNRTRGGKTYFVSAQIDIGPVGLGIISGALVAYILIFYVFV